MSKVHKGKNHENPSKEHFKFKNVISHSNTIYLHTRYENNKIENGVWEWVKKTTTLPKHRKHPKTINGFSTQLENSTLGGGLQLAPKINEY